MTSGQLTAGERLTAAGAGAVLLGCAGFLPVFAGQAWLLPVVGVVLAVAVAGVLSRRLRLPAALQPLIGLVVVTGYTVLLYARHSLHHVLLPGRDTGTAVRALLDAAGADLASYAPPAPTTTALVMLVVLGVGGVAVLVDTCAVVAGRAALAGLPLLVLFAVPSAVLAGELGWFAFVASATGWLGLLLLEGRERMGRWGTPLAIDARAQQDPGAINRVGRRIGAAALGVAVVVPVLLPALDARTLFGGGGTTAGSAGSGRSHNVTTYNPITRLKGQLNLPSPKAVVHYTTNDPAPDYLRLTTLGVYDGAGWRQESLSGNLRQNGVDKQLPLPLGRATTVVTRPVVDHITLVSLDAYWLPVPATPIKVDVKGPWMWDTRSESVFATRTATKKLPTYVAHSLRSLPSAALLSTTATGDVPETVRPYSGDISARTSDSVRRITAEATRGQSTAYGKALAIQAYFHTSHFEYSTQTPPGTSADALDSFLNAGKGYCEQYASAMAAMLRVAGIPSRVAIGFTAGTTQSDGSRLVTTSDAHAWPEAWFAGVGWTRFEPTPSVGTISTPNYGPVTAGGPTAQAPVVPGGTNTPDTAGETPQQRAQRLEEERLARSGAPAATPRHTVRSLLPTPRTAVAMGLVILVVFGPSLVHRRRTRHRWRTSDAGVAWDQLRDDARDVGHRWLDTDTPRSAANRLIADRYLDAPVNAAVLRLATALERPRYARPAGEPAAGNAGDVALVRSALLAGARPRVRLRARFLPPSTLTWTASVLGTAVADVLDGVDHMLAGTTGWARSRLPGARLPSRSGAA